MYRLICKETVEEKILQRASQKNAVQQLVMTGGHVQGDLLAPEDVVSLLLDDPQLEQKLREIPFQVGFKFDHLLTSFRGLKFGYDLTSSPIVTSQLVISAFHLTNNLLFFLAGKG